MKLLVLTSEGEIKDEANVLNLLFENGLMTLHLRKPLFEVEDYQTLLDKIKPEFYKRIVMHNKHELCGQYGLKGVHLQENKRLTLDKKLFSYVAGFKSNGYHVSSSFHTPEEIEEAEIIFDYVLLSPVFNSISKVGYEGKGYNVRHLKSNVFGMGGVNEHTIQKTYNLGYQGAGVLGGIWNSKDYLKSFKTIQKACENVVKLVVK